jgi:hypothetical protein
MDEKEMRNYIYLCGMLETFQKRAVEYYLEGDSDEERFNRLKYIRELLLNRQHQPSLSSDGALSGPWLSVAGFRRRNAEIAFNTPGEATNNEGFTQYPNCRDGEVCRGGVCVDASLPFEWGEGTDDDPTDI